MAQKNEVWTNLGLLWLRALMGAGIAYHGYQIIFGGGMDGLIQGVEKMGFPIPQVFAWAAALSEFVGGVFIVFGLWTRYAALAVLTTMGVAFFIAHKHDPLKVKELAAAYATIAGALLLIGAGSFSLDAKMGK